MSSTEGRRTLRARALQTSSPTPSQLTIYNFSSIFPNNESAISLFISYGLLPNKNNPLQCLTCNNNLTINHNSNSKLQYILKCAFCNTRISPTEGTFFFDARISFIVYLQIVVSFLSKHTVSSVMQNIPGLSSATVVAIYRRLRKACETHISHYYDKSTYSSLDLFPWIGGNGLHVEVDETFLNKRKRGVGRPQAGESLTILGIVCRETGDRVFFNIPDKSTLTQLPIMAYFIHPDSTLCTDSGAQYLSPSIKDHFKEHYTVNHRLNFLNPNNWEHNTQTIERANRDFKDHIISIRGDELEDVEDRLNTYIGYYLYFHKKLDIYNRENLADETILSRKLSVFLTDLAKLYPGNFGPNPLPRFSLSDLNERFNNNECPGFRERELTTRHLTETETETTFRSLRDRDVPVETTPVKRRKH